ncbi:MAG: oxidoreductase family protein [Promethearchaeota archaeon]
MNVIPGNIYGLNKEWLNNVLHKYGYLVNENILNLTIEKIGVGEGFVSDMVRLHIEYDNNNRGLPKTMIVKMPTSYTPALGLAKLYRLYEREIKFYLEVAPESPIGTPEIIYADYDVDNFKFVLIMEDCSFCTPGDSIAGLTYEQTKQAISAIADFHSYWWNHEKFKTGLKWMGRPRGFEPMSLIGTFRGTWDIAKNSEDFKLLLPEGSMEVGNKIYEGYPWIIDSVRDEYLTICHFDYRADNIFFNPENKEKPVIVIDWGSANITGGLLDVAYIMAASVSVDLRREIEKEILDLYYNRFIEEVGDEDKYTWDIYIEDYKKSLMCYLYLTPVTFTSLDLSSERGTQLFKLGAERIFSALIENDATSVLPKSKS